MEKISILIPAYNQENFIEKAIESAINVNYPNKEVIVCDDCSTDYTFNIAKKYESLGVKVYRNEKNIGMIQNHRKLITLASGKWGIILDGDDFFVSKDFIKIAFKRINFYQFKDKIVAISFGIQTYRYEDGKYYLLHTYKNNEKIIDGKEAVLHNKGLCNNGNILFRLDIIKQISPFRAKHTMYEDSETYYRLFLHGKVYFSKEIAYGRVLHRTNQSLKYTPEERFIGIKYFIDSVVDYAINDLKEPRDVWEQYRKKAMIRFLIQEIQNYVGSPQLEKYIKFLEDKIPEIRYNLNYQIRKFLAKNPQLFELARTLYLKIKNFKRV